MGSLWGSSWKMNFFNLGWKASHSVYQILQFYLKRIVSISNSTMLHSVDLYKFKSFLSQ
jgi:hypothetical protein